MYRPIAATVLALCASAALAQPAEEQPLAAPPPPQSRVAGDPTEPEINITERAEGMVYEYRVRGRVYMVKVQPQIGPPYYFFDSNGDGLLDARGDAPPSPWVQQWILTSW
jgi:hypothetical protein